MHGAYDCLMHAVSIDSGCADTWQTVGTVYMARGQAAGGRPARVSGPPFVLPHETWAGESVCAGLLTEISGSHRWPTSKGIRYTNQVDRPSVA